MNRQRLLAMCFITSVMLILFGCRKDNTDGVDSTETVAVSTDEYKKYSLSEISDNLKIIGRSTTDGQGITCDFTASGIEFTAEFQGELKLTLYATDTSYFTFIVDGVSSERICVNSGESTVTVASSENMSEHSVRIIKQTEAQMSLVTLKSLELKGKLSGPAPNKDTYIEFIGDSITCGFGNLCENVTPDAGTSLYEDGTKAYAFLTAEKMNADYSMVSCSGIGVDIGWADDNISAFYPLLSYYRSKTEMHKPDRTPDIAVVNLGRNDYTKGQSTEDSFKREMNSFVASLRALYGNETKIVWVYGMMGPCMENSIIEVISELGGENANLYAVELPANYDGGGSHPSAEAHESAATELSAVLLRLLERK